MGGSAAGWYKTNNFVSQLGTSPNSSSSAWIGLIRIGSKNNAKDFTWIDGSPLKFNLLSNAYPIGSNCVQLNEKGKWNPKKCQPINNGNKDKRFVCQRGDKQGSGTKTIMKLYKNDKV